MEARQLLYFHFLSMDCFLKFLRFCCLVFFSPSGKTSKTQTSKSLEKTQATVKGEENTLSVLFMPYMNQLRKKNPKPNTGSPARYCILKVHFSKHCLRTWVSCLISLFSVATDDSRELRQGLKMLMKTELKILSSYLLTIPVPSSIVLVQCCFTILLTSTM